MMGETRVEQVIDAVDIVFVLEDTRELPDQTRERFRDSTVLLRSDGMVWPRTSENVSTLFRKLRLSNLPAYESRC